MHINIFTKYFILSQVYLHSFFIPCLITCSNQVIILVFITRYQHESSNQGMYFLNTNTSTFIYAYVYSLVNLDLNVVTFITSRIISYIYHHWYITILTNFTFYKNTPNGYIYNRYKRLYLYTINKPLNLILNIFTLLC